MASQGPQERAQHIQEPVVLQSILQQLEAAVAAQSNSQQNRSQQDTFLQTDLTTFELDEDNVPPPAYGDTYGEIGIEKNGLGTSARVTDDGRVNIRINQLNRRLSQIFIPALSQDAQDVQDSSPPPPLYIPSSLGGDEGAPRPPPLNVVIHVVGSRGDVQPFVALGKVLKNSYGHRVRLATHPNFKDFVEEHGLEFFSIGGDPSELMAFMVKNPNLLPGLESLFCGEVSRRRKDVAGYIQGCWRSCYETGDGMAIRNTDNDLVEQDRNDAASPFVADCIIANPPSFAHIHCAEKLGIPLHIMFTMPYSATQAFPHPLANIQSSNADPQLTNYMSYAMIELLSWQGLSDIINRFRAKCLGLDPVSLMWGPGMVQRLKVPHTYCWSPALISKPKDWGPHISISGFYFLNLASDYAPASDFQAFLDAGPPPVYIGFGSIVLDDPNRMTELIFEAARRTGQRILLSKGWGGMGADELEIPDSVFILGNVPHDWLFKHVSCVVHHGGAGTTAAGITAGRPTLVVPFFGDQPFWGAMVARAGAGPDPIPYKRLTADNLADAIEFCLKAETLQCAKELASKITAERGSEMGAQTFHQHLKLERLRCSLAPTRASVWRVKRTKVTLSAFAACTLANANLLDFHDLKLFRPQEYQTDQGPLDPISGGFTAFLGSISGMLLGLADFPTETYKAFRPSGSSKQPSQSSVVTSASRSKTSISREGSTLTFESGQSETSLNVQEPLALVQSPVSVSSVPSATSSIRSKSASTTSQSQSRPKEDSNSGRRSHKSSESRSVKDNDMLRPVTHVSKGAGRFVKSLVEGPMNIAVNLTQGSHNIPRLWNDDTVRPHEKVSDFKSGIRAVGREFGFGWYDGVTGIVTQPWKGAQKDGASGFLKGVGKGIGGFLTKPLAGMLGVPGYMMKGVIREVQGLFGSNVQNYIVASRVAQGYEDWLQSSDAEKQDVITRWKLIRKYLKKRCTKNRMIQNLLEAQWNQEMEKTETRHALERTADSIQSVQNADTATLSPENTTLAIESSQSSLHSLNTGPEESPRAVRTNSSRQQPVLETRQGTAEENSTMVQAIQADVSLLHHQRKEAEDHGESLRQAMLASKAQAQRHANEASEYEQQLERIIAQSLLKQRQNGSDSGSESDIYLDSMSFNEEDDEVFELGRGNSQNMPENTLAGGLSGVKHDPGHLEGTTQSEFEAQQLRQLGEKTASEKTEEEIVLEYIKKQSLLEVHHRHQNKGKSRAIVNEDEDENEGDEDLQKASELSIQGHQLRQGAASGT